MAAAAAKGSAESEAPPPVSLAVTPLAAAAAAETVSMSPQHDIWRRMCERRCAEVGGVAPLGAPLPGVLLLLPGGVVAVAVVV